MRVKSSSFSGLATKPPSSLVATFLGLPQLREDTIAQYNIFSYFWAYRTSILIIHMTHRIDVCYSYLYYGLVEGLSMIPKYLRKIVIFNSISILYFETQNFLCSGRYTVLCFIKIFCCLFLNLYPLLNYQNKSLFL